MATFVRNRIIQQLSWAPEDDAARARRREILCELDGMLGQLEEINLRGGTIPERVLIALRRRGITPPGRINAADLIEAIFAAQESFMRQPEGAPADALLHDLRRRLAS